MIPGIFAGWQLRRPVEDGGHAQSVSRGVADTLGGDSGGWFEPAVAFRSDGWQRTGYEEGGFDPAAQRFAIDGGSRICRGLRAGRLLGLGCRGLRVDAGHTRQKSSSAEEKRLAVSNGQIRVCYNVLDGVKVKQVVHR